MIEKIAKFELKCERRGITVKNFLKNLWTIIVDIVFVIAAFGVGLPILGIPGIVWYQLSLPASRCQIVMVVASSMCFWLALMAAIVMITAVVLMIIHVHKEIRRTKKEIANKK